MRSLLRNLIFLIPMFGLSAADLPWETDLEVALKRAKAEKKTVLLDVWTDWCGWCHRLKKDVFPNPRVQEALSKVIPVAVMTQDKQGRPTPQKGVEQRYGVRGFPALFILDENGKVLREQPGYLPPQEMVKFIEGK